MIEEEFNLIEYLIEIKAELDISIDDKHRKELWAIRNEIREKLLALTK